MSTALEIIKRARRLLGVLGVGETLEYELANNGLEALNALLESWSLDQLAVYVTKINTHVLTSAQTFTVGLGGAFNIERPNRIESAYIKINNLDYPLTLINNDQWNDITTKTISASIPMYLKYDANVPLGNISLYPSPQVGATLTINTFQSLQQFPNLSTVMILPTGYERAIASNLALDIAPEANRQVSQELVKMARESKSAIMRINARAVILSLDPMFGGYSYGSSLQMGLNG